MKKIFKTLLIILVILSLVLLIYLLIPIKSYSKNHGSSKKYKNKDLNNSDFVELRTINYNVFGRWFGVTGYEGQDDRLTIIPSAIANHPKMGKTIDVITIEEAWCPESQFVSGKVMCGSNASRNLLIKEMTKQGWKYHTDVIQPCKPVFTKQTGGGVIVFSRWPIEATYQYVYKSCVGQDCHAAKGVIYTRIIKKTSNNIEQAFNIFATHLQAWPTPEGAEARKNQLSELYNIFLPSIGIPTDGTEPIIFQGDMNTDEVLYPEEVDNMKKILHATIPDHIGDQLYSSDPSTNFLVGKDGAADSNKCLDEYQKSLNVDKNQTGIVPIPPPLPCKNIPKTTSSGKPFNSRFANSDGSLKLNKDCKAYCPCCSFEYLDYILYSNENKYLQPIKSTIEIIPLKSPIPLNYKWGWCSDAACLINKKQTVNLIGNDLSDHYPVVGNFIFKPITKKFSILDGCKNDLDCHLELSGSESCFCTGPGCTLNGVKVNGYDKGVDDKVNKNCQYRGLQTNLVTADLEMLNIIKF